MHIFTDLLPLQAYLKSIRAADRTIGFVPTMGALHAGHLSLISRAKETCDVVVCSIYINPTQFNNKKDLVNYPRTVDTDLELLKKANCDIVFLPNDQVMYPMPTRLTFNFGYLETMMEGKFRPGHFNGVATVVSKLFHMVNPDTAFFGQKDLQQFAVIRQMVADLSFSIKLVSCPILRENNGLAMSSRNMRLNAEQKESASILYQTLQQARKWTLQSPIAQVKQAVEDKLSKSKVVQLEYFEIVDSQTLEPVKDIALHKQISLCIAAYVGEVRLIDNMLLNE